VIPKIKQERHLWVLLHRPLSSSALCSAWVEQWTMYRHLWLLSSYAVKQDHLSHRHWGVCMCSVVPLPKNRFAFFLCLWFGRSGARDPKKKEKKQEEKSVRLCSSRMNSLKWIYRMMTVISCMPFLVVCNCLAGTTPSLTWPHWPTAHSTRHVVEDCLLSGYIPSMLSEATSLLICIREVPGSNFGQDKGYLIIFWDLPLSLP
jgi:hypothetical protein